MRSLHLGLLAACFTAPVLAQQPMFVPPVAAQPAASASAQQPTMVQPGRDPSVIPALQAQPGIQPPPGTPQLPPGVAGPQIEAGAAARARIQMEGMTTAPAPGANGGSVPKEMPPPVQVISPDRAMTKKEEAGVAAAQRWIVQAQTPHLDHDGVLHFTDGHGQVQIVASVNHVTDIRLEPGENILLPISIGDSEDWVIHTVLGRQDG
jgi:hypothetical protein